MYALRTRWATAFRVLVQALEYARVRLLECARVPSSMLDYARVRLSMLECARVCLSTLEYMLQCARAYRRGTTMYSSYQKTWTMVFTTLKHTTCMVYDIRFTSKSQIRCKLGYTMHNDMHYYAVCNIYFLIYHIIWLI